MIEKCTRDNRFVYGYVTTLLYEKLLYVSFDLDFGPNFYIFLQLNIKHISGK